MRFSAVVGGLAIFVSACCTAKSNPKFAAKMGEACLTIEGCRELMAELDVEQKRCEVGPRPTNCIERQAQYDVVRRQVTLLDAHARKLGEAEASAAGQAERDAEAEALEAEHASFSAEGQAKADVEVAWTKVDPKRCALGGEEDACYDLVRFIALTGDGPHGAEARAALEAGQRLIAERQSSGGSK